MAARGDASVLPILRDAIRNEIVPGPWQGSSWEWICKTLRSWDDDSIVPHLNELIKGHFLKYNQSKTLPVSALDGIISGVSMLKSEAISQTVIDYWKEPDAWASSPNKDYMTKWVGLSLTKATAFAGLQHAISIDDTGFMFDILISRAGQVADDQRTALTLYRFIERQKHSWWAVKGYEALHAICQRGRFRLFPDGSVETVSDAAR